MTLPPQTKHNTHGQCPHRHLVGPNGLRSKTTAQNEDDHLKTRTNAPMTASTPRSPQTTASAHERMWMRDDDDDDYRRHCRWFIFNTVSTPVASTHTTQLT
jgi:hypothetical protein